MADLSKIKAGISAARLKSYLNGTGFIATYYRGWNCKDKYNGLLKAFVLGFVAEAKDPRKKYKTEKAISDTVCLDLFGVNAAEMFRSQSSSSGACLSNDRSNMWSKYTKAKASVLLTELGIFSFTVWDGRNEAGLPVYVKIMSGGHKGSIGRHLGWSKAGNLKIGFDNPKKKLKLNEDWKPVLKEKVKTKYKYTKPKPKPEELFEQPVDMLGADISVGDIVNFQATHPRPGGCDYFTALGTVSSISKTGKTIKAKLFYGWKSYLGVDKQVNPDRVMIVSDEGFKKRLMLLKLKG